MRPVTPSTQYTHDEPDAYVIAVSEVVGTCAAGQSTRGTYEVAVEAPVGTFASGLGSDLAGSEPFAGRRMHRPV